MEIVEIKEQIANISGLVTQLTTNNTYTDDLHVGLGYIYDDLSTVIMCIHKLMINRCITSIYEDVEDNIRQQDKKEDVVRQDVVIEDVVDEDVRQDAKVEDYTCHESQYYNSGHMPQQMYQGYDLSQYYNSGHMPQQMHQGYDLSQYYNSGHMPQQMYQGYDMQEQLYAEHIERCKNEGSKLPAHIIEEAMNPTAKKNGNGAHGSAASEKKISIDEILHSLNMSRLDAFHRDFGEQAEAEERAAKEAARLGSKTFTVPSAARKRKGARSVPKPFFSNRESEAIYLNREYEKACEIKPASITRMTKFPNIAYAIRKVQQRMYIRKVSWDMMLEIGEQRDWNNKYTYIILDTLRRLESGEDFGTILAGKDLDKLISNINIVLDIVKCVK